MFYYVYKDANRQWRWTLYAANHRKIANSGEGYHNRLDCYSAINLVQRSAAAPIQEQAAA